METSTKKELEVTISDLLYIIHYTIIKYKKENDVILEELQAIDEKITSGSLLNYAVNDVAFWKSMINIIGVYSRPSLSDIIGDEQCNSIIDSLHDYGKRADKYCFGLPTSKEDMNNMRQIIKNSLTKKI